MRKILIILTTAILIPTAVFAEVRVKDIASIHGVRDNQLVGYGLVVGLDGSGDKQGTYFTVATIVSMLQRLGIKVPQSQVTVKNVAAVMVTATLPPFAKSGSKLDVTVSSIGDAKNIQGGTLLMTPLKAVDGNVYALAQGPVSIGGFNVSGGAVQKNHVTAGKVPQGATVEKEVPNSFQDGKAMNLVLHNPDFTTATRMTEAINRHFKAGVAYAVDSGTIRLDIPSGYEGRQVELVAAVEGLRVNPDAVAKVVINERTGTVVMGDDVRISTVAISHGNLSITVTTEFQVSQPAPLSEGETVVVPRTETKVEEKPSRLVVLPSGVSIGEVVKALNSLGVTARDMISILQAIRAAGALQADLEII